MGVVTRIVDVINSNINTALDKAEQPEKMIRLVIQELEETLVDVRSHAAKCIAETKSLQRSKLQTEQDVQNWLEKAEVALKKQREDLAKQALVEKVNAESSLVLIQDEMVAVEQQLALITDDISALQEKLSEAKQKQASLTQRENFSATRLKAKTVTRESNLQQLEQQYQRVLRNIDRVESECDAHAMTTNNQRLKTEFDELIANDNLEQEMSALKQKLAQN